MRALFWFSNTATLFSRHFMYSFFLFRHSLAASRFFINLTSLFLTASSAGPAGAEAEVVPPPAVATMTCCVPALPPPPPPLLPPLLLPLAEVTVPGMNTVCPFCDVAVYCTTPPPEAEADEAAEAATLNVCSPSDCRAAGDTI